jgi:hypothetical protein
MPKKQIEKERCDFSFVPWGYRCIHEKGHKDQHEYAHDAMRDVITGKGQWSKTMPGREETNAEKTD